MRNSGRNRSQRVFIRRKLKKRCSLFLSLSISVYTNKGQEIQNKFPFIKSLSLPRILPIPSFQISVNLQISNLDNESDTSLKIIDRRAEQRVREQTSSREVLFVDFLVAVIASFLLTGGITIFFWPIQAVAGELKINLEPRGGSANVNENLKWAIPECRLKVSTVVFRGTICKLSREEKIAIWSRQLRCWHWRGIERAFESSIRTAASICQAERFFDLKSENQSII